MHIDKTAYWLTKTQKKGICSKNFIYVVVVRQYKENYC